SRCRRWHVWSWFLGCRARRSCGLGLALPCVSCVVLGAPSPSVLFRSYRLDQLVFGHLAGLDAELSGPIDEFVFRPVFQAGRGFAGTLCPLVFSFAAFAPLLVYGSGCDFLGAVFGFALGDGALFDMLVL